VLDVASAVAMQQLVRDRLDVERGEELTHGREHREISEVDDPQFAARRQVPPCVVDGAALVREHRQGVRHENALGRRTENGCYVGVLGKAGADACPSAAARGVRAHDLARLQPAERRLRPTATQAGEVAPGARTDLHERRPLAREQALEHAVAAEQVVLARYVVDAVREPVVAVEERPVGGLRVGRHAPLTTR
jgi:hypothetical protein